MSHKLALPIVTLLLLAALLIPSSLGNITSSVALQSAGTILYLTNDKLMGVDFLAWFDVPLTPLTDIVKNAGGNAWRQNMISDCYTDQYWFSTMKNLKNDLDQRGIKLIIATMGVDSWLFDFNWQEQADIIVNVNGSGDKWINDWGNIIKALNPYAIDVMNEPMGIEGTTYAPTMTQQQFFDVYRQFVIRAIEAWRQIKPDLVCIVANCPFYKPWEETGFDVNPINESNIIYSYHYYYSYDGNYPPSYLPEQIDYWEGRLSEGKKLLGERIDSDTLPMRNKGFTVLVEETGSNVANPNALVFMQDWFDLCKERNLGVIQHALAPYPREIAGMLNEDWTTLNALGKVWARNMGS